MKIAVIHDYADVFCTTRAYHRLKGHDFLPAQRQVDGAGEARVGVRIVQPEHEKVFAEVLRDQLDHLAALVQDDRGKEASARGVLPVQRLRFRCDPNPFQAKRAPLGAFEATECDWIDAPTRVQITQVDEEAFPVAKRVPAARTSLY